MKKLSDQITWFQNNALRLLQEYWGRFLLALVAITVVSLLIIWTSDIKPYERFDLTLKTIGGLFLIIGLVIAAWRSMIAARQASSMERQVSNMESQVSNMESQVSSTAKGQYSDRFTKAVEQIANDQLAIRLGGLASIEALSKETEDEFIRVWKYLGHFLHYPPELAQAPNQQEVLGRRPDIAAVAAMLHDDRNKTHLRWVEGNQLPLRYANLQGADLFDANLQDAELSSANLQGARLFKANLQGADLESANLQGAGLSSANLQGADLKGANLQDARLFKANLQGADLRDISLLERDLQQLFSKEDGVLLKGALFSLDVLKKVLHIKGLMPEKMFDVYYDASDGPLPDDWPDYRPRPITYEEWWGKKNNY